MAGSKISDGESKVCYGSYASPMCKIISLNIKITISSIVIGSQNSYFPLIHLLSCLSDS